MFKTTSIKSTKRLEKLQKKLFIKLLCDADFRSRPVNRSVISEINKRIIITP